MTNGLLISVKFAHFLIHILGSSSSNMTLHPITSEFPYTWGKHCFLFLSVLLVSNIKTHIGQWTYRTVSLKYVFDYSEWMFPQHILTFQSWENIYRISLTEFWITWSQKELAKPHSQIPNVKIRKENIKFKGLKYESPALLKSNNFIWEYVVSCNVDSWMAASVPYFISLQNLSSNRTL